MKRLLSCFLLAISLAVFAQQDTGEETEPGSVTEQPATDGGVEPPQAQDEAEPDDVDFKPGEEISEDFPVPLPSDI